MRRAILMGMVSIAGCDQTFGIVRVPEAMHDGSIADVPVDGLTDGGVGVDVVPPTDCPLSYDRTYTNATTRYRFVSSGVVWAVAAQDCADDRINVTGFTHLAVLGDDQERGAMYPAIAGSAGSIWVGLSDRVTEGAFKWVTDENSGYPPSTAWFGGNGPDGNGNCVLVRASSSELDDVDCVNAVTAGYVCECDAFANAPANY